MRDSVNGGSNKNSFSYTKFAAEKKTGARKAVSSTKYVSQKKKK